MDKDFALNLSAEIGIDLQQVIREETELIFLKGLFESSLSDRIVFKGGTALRLVYGSMRFSEDLDFSTTSNISADEFRAVITNITKSDERFSIKDLASKYYTHLAEIRVKELWREIPFSVKIEISKRVLKKGEANTASLLVKSPATNISVMVKVFTLESILKDKLKALNDRKMSRDIFDIWFICQKTNQSFVLKNFGYQKGKLKQELRKFLPRKLYPVIDNLEKLNAANI